MQESHVTEGGVGVSKGQFAASGRSARARLLRLHGHGRAPCDFAALTVCAAAVSAQVVMLYVDEDTSINRQMARAEIATRHNKRILDAETGDLR